MGDPGAVGRAAAVAVVVLLLSPHVWAEEARQPVIESGREAEIVRLIAPYTADGPVSGGWRVEGIAVERDRIRIKLSRTDVDPTGADPTGAEPTHTRGSVELDLVHPSRAPHRRWSSASFAMTTPIAQDRVPLEEGAEEALARIATAVRTNDAGGFWRVEAEAPPQVQPTRTAASGLGHTLSRWVMDGLVLLFVGLALLSLLAWRQLRLLPPFTTWTLLGVVGLGVVLRVFISVPTTMTAWGYERLHPLAAAIHAGPALPELCGLLGVRVDLLDIVSVSNLIVAAFTPLSVFLLANPLLRDARAALAAAMIVAVVPVAIRFSQSDVYFVLSIAASSTAFALLFTAASDGSRRCRTLAIIALPPMSWVALTTRPLDVLMAPLFIVAAALFVRAPAPRWRAAVVLILSGLGVAAAVALLDARSGSVGEGLGLGTLLGAGETLFTLRLNTLINPWVTPPIVPALATLGGVVLWRRGERRLASFLVVWLAMFFVAHAVILPDETVMQARYHLHLLLPLALLAAVGGASLLRWRRWTVAPLLACALMAPLVHLDFERDVAFDSQRELAFLERASELIPEGCTVLEYTGVGDDRVASRLRRVGAFVSREGKGDRWRVVETGAGVESGTEPLSSEATRALSAGAGCVVVYQGQACWGRKQREDAIAPACAVIQGRAELIPLAETAFSPRPYDRNLATGYEDGLQRVELKLWRVKARGQ